MRFRRRPKFNVTGVNFPVIGVGSRGRKRPTSVPTAHYLNAQQRLLNSGR